MTATGATTATIGNATVDGACTTLFDVTLIIVIVVDVVGSWYAVTPSIGVSVGADVVNVVGAVAGQRSTYMHMIATRC